jgi:amino acid adenylation domain-containing protein
MTDLSGNIAGVSRQQSIRAKCFHPTGRFVEFKKEEIEQSIPDRFEKIVRMHPDRLAVKTRNHQFTYDELNKAANRVAHAILAQRGKEEEPIALILENDAPMIVGALGVLKAGKIFVTIDPSNPRARNAYILEDSQVNLIVTNNKNFYLAKDLSQNPLPLINIDERNASLSNEASGVSISADALAFILYTSGSTGQPKGVLRNHRNELHYTMCYTNAYRICPDDRLSLLGSHGSGQSIMSIWRALLNGASLCPLNLKEEGLAYLAEWLIQEEISILYVGVAIFRHFIGTLTGVERFPKLRLIRLASEPVSKSDVELFERHFSTDCLLANGLAISEAGIIRECFIDKRTSIGGSMAPLGYPVEDKEILLFDEAGKEVGLNCVGEIAVKSRYLSPGYWRKPGLTLAKFLPDPNGGNEPIYLTGDLGRMLADGCLEHLGRKDFQVKIRGYTIEPAEIEMRLLDHAAIKEVVVVAREDVSGNKCLVAYIVPTGQPMPTASELRRGLAENLPDHMVPSAFVMLDALPLTPNGKVDRHVLPAPDRARPDLVNTFVAPRTPTEEVLARIWAEVLSLDRVGIHDNFLELGGHSLLATQIISRVLDRFHVGVPLRSLFETPTVADMAVVITQHQAGKAKPEEMARILAEIESLSEYEVKHFLAQEMREKEA